MKKEHFLFTEKFRPTTVQECIVAPHIKEAFQEYVNRKEIPNLLLSGNPGCGKTGIAVAACKEIGLDYLFINTSTDNGIDILRNKITNYATSVSLSGGRKVIIMDEFDGSSPNMQAGLKSCIESFSNNCTFIFTCNHKNKIIEPIHSRCAVFEFSVSNKKEKQKLMGQFFKRVCWILEQENIEYNKEVVSQVLIKYFPDNRRVLNELQRYATSGKIDAGLLSESSSGNLDDLVGFIKEKSIKDIRIWLTSENIDPSTFYRAIYNKMYDLLNPNYVPEFIIIIGRYQYQNAFVADSELNTLAFLTEVLCNAEFK
jgi:DNA polymerase III delta prime subunit